MKRKDWISNGVLPRRGVSILAGPPKLGKSFFCLEFCRALVTGDNAFGHPTLTVPEPARVLYIEDEVKEDGLSERGNVIFAGLEQDYLDEHMHIISGAAALRFDTVDGWRLLEHAIQKARPNVLVLDPIGRLIGGADENRNDEMGRILGRLDQILETYADWDMSLVLAHHSRKPFSMGKEQPDPLDPNNMRGSSRFRANPDTILMLNRTETWHPRPGIKAWKVAGRFETRQAEGPDECLFHVNEMGDLRVRYVEKPGIPKLDKAVVEKKKIMPLNQLGFEAAPATSA